MSANPQVLNRVPFSAKPAGKGKSETANRRRELAACIEQIENAPESDFEFSDTDVFGKAFLEQSERMTQALEDSRDVLAAMQKGAIEKGAAMARLFENGLIMDKKTGVIRLADGNGKSAKADLTNGGDKKITSADIQTGLREAGMQAFADELAYQDQLIHWNILRHKKTMYLAAGIAIGVVATAYGPRLVAKIRGVDTDADGDVEYLREANG